MLKFNEKMKVLLEQNVFSNIVDIKQLCESIISKTRCINDCILYDEDAELDEKTINWDFVLKINFDLSGYEVSQNELVLTDDLFCWDSMIEFLTGLNSLLQNKFADKRFCLIVHYNGIGVLRFHTYREEEGLWLDKALEKYEEAVLYFLDE
ncbi:MAG: hypothetical protein K2H13_05535 [Eubacterium sp.]|nr:hypothetical protein [Eubacterium sp.]MDE6155926.1 hypothetical protein [Eubacterium sp.]MDE6767786.1 hypothetical protein [Eubacterium sp.]